MTRSLAAFRRRVVVSMNGLVFGAMVRLELFLGNWDSYLSTLGRSLICAAMLVRAIALTHAGGTGGSGLGALARWEVDVALNRRFCWLASERS